MSKLPLLVLAGVLAVGLADDHLTFPPCRTDDDCLNDANIDAGTTKCSYIFKTAKYDAATPRQPTGTKLNFGYCVQCTSNTDCGVNQWCQATKAVTEKWWNADDAVAMVEAEVNRAKKEFAALKGGQLKLLSQCVEYDHTESDDSNKVGKTCSPTVNSGMYSKDPAYTVDSSVCGYTSSWMPEFYSCVSSGIEGAASCPTASDDDSLKVGSAQKYKPGACLAYVDGAAQTVQALGGAICSANGWSGFCSQGTCAVCKDGATKWAGNVKQRCIGQVWQAALKVDRSVYTVDNDVTAQLSASIFSFMIWLWAIVCCTCLAVGRAAKAGQPQE